MMDFTPYILPVALTFVLLILMRVQASSAKKAIRKAEERLHALEQKLASAESDIREELRKSSEEKDLKITRLHEDLRAALASGEQIKLSGFGNFDLRDKNQRPGRNPKTGKEIPITARRVVTFRPGQKLKARVEAYAGAGK